MGTAAWVCFDRLSGLYMAAYAYGGVVAKMAFAGLAVFCLHTGIRAFLAIRAGDVAAHRQWMVRNVSLTLVAVTLRIYLPTSMMAGLPFELVCPLIVWMAWVPNRLIAERWFNGPPDSARDTGLPGRAV